LNQYLDVGDFMTVTQSFTYVHATIVNTLFYVE